MVTGGKHQHRNTLDIRASAFASSWNRHRRPPGSVPGFVWIQSSHHSRTSANGSAGWVKGPWFKLTQWYTPFKKIGWWFRSLPCDFMWFPNIPSDHCLWISPFPTTTDVFGYSLWFRWKSGSWQAPISAHGDVNMIVVKIKHMEISSGYDIHSSPW